jgi:nitric oxide reductase large subunit
MKKNQSILVLVIGLCIFISSFIIKEVATSNYQSILENKGATRQEHAEKLRENYKIAEYLRIGGIVVTGIGALLMIVSAIDKK